MNDGPLVTERVRDDINVEETQDGTNALRFTDITKAATSVYIDNLEPGGDAVVFSTEEDLENEVLVDNLDQRFDASNEKCRFATQQEVTRLFPRVCVYDTNKTVMLLSSPAEFYLLKDLRHLDHSFETGNQPPTAFELGQTTHTIPPLVDEVNDEYTKLYATVVAQVILISTSKI